LYKSPEEVLFRQAYNAKEIFMDDQTESSADESDEESIEEIEVD
jgi:hypothetical protein